MWQEHAVLRKKKKGYQMGVEQKKVLRTVAGH